MPPKFDREFREQFDEFGRGGPIRPNSNNKINLPPLENEPRPLSNSISQPNIPGLNAS